MFTDSSKIKTFIEAGKATITIESTKTSKYFTYKFTKHKIFKNIYFVKLLSGIDKSSNYVYIGVYDSRTMTFNLTKKSRLPREATSIIALKYFINCIVNNTIPSALKVYHADKCGRCGRKLTTPDSINSGFGPECINHI